MPHQPETTAPADWHRYFAMEHNNRAWELAAKAPRSAAEDAEMLDAAHTAAAHWKAVGTELHIARAEMLLAAVHALLGFGETAWALAERVTRYFSDKDSDDWEQAFIHTFHAHAAYANGRKEDHRASYARARSTLNAIADAEDRKIVQASFDQVPVPQE